QKYGRIANIIAKAAEIKGVVGQTFRDFIPNFDMTRQLVTVKSDCALAVIDDDPESLTPVPHEKDLLIELFQVFGFRTFLRELTNDPDIERESGRRQKRRETQTEADVAVTASDEGAIIEPETISYHTITTEDEHTAWLHKLQEADIVALDTEATSLDPMQARLVGLSFSIQPGEGAY